MEAGADPTCGIGRDDHKRRRRQQHAPFEKAKCDGFEYMKTSFKEASRAYRAAATQGAQLARAQHQIRTGKPGLQVDIRLVRCRSQRLKKIKY